MGIKVNFTDTATYGNSSLGLDPLPTGKYHVAITDGEIRESGPNSKNPGSQYINFEFTVQSGDYEGRKVWANASLLPHALYTIKGILEALGYETSGNELDFEMDDLMNKELIVKVNFLKAGKVGDRDLDDRNEVKRFYKLESGTSQLSSSGSTSGGKTSLLP
jgi:hypothetical protein